MKSLRSPLLILSALTLALAASSALAADQYIVRVPANVQAVPPSEPTPPLDPISVTLSDLALPAGMVGQPYTFNLANRLTLAGGTGEHNDSEAVWSLKAGDALPAGLALSGGTISGTPTVKNTTGTPFEVTATYKDANGKQVYTIVVNGAVLQVTQIAVGAAHTCAITPGGAAKCWGQNQYGNLGDGTKTHSILPKTVKDLGSGVTHITTTYNHVCAVQNGGVKCWGYNQYGQLGNNTTTDSSSPVAALGLETGVREVHAGYYSTCALLEDGSVKCWGKSNTSYSSSLKPPILAINIGGKVISMSNGRDLTCAILENSSAKCWGINSSSQMGSLGSDTDTPRQVTGLTSGVTAISAGHLHACAVHDGAAKCWGSSQYGKTGVNTAYDVEKPTAVANLGHDVLGISAGYNHSCAWTQAGVLYCWGYGTDGAIGDGANQHRYLPVLVSGHPGTVSAVAGTSHTCAISGRGASCWGNNNAGKLGDGTMTNKNVPVEVQP